MTAEPSLLRHYVGLVLAEAAVIIAVAVALWRVRVGLDGRPRRPLPPWARSRRG